jgi:cytochrome b pre-mRNA-processing protein 3
MNWLKRLHKFLTRPVVDPAVAEIYNRCVAQARRPEFYRLLAMPDTLDGRFDLLLLHILMVMRRLGAEIKVKQQLFDLMFADMDRSLREMGVGDMSVGKKIKPMISAFYGREQAYEKALGESDAALQDVLNRNLYAAAAIEPDILRQMAGYVRRSILALEKQPLPDLVSGHVEFMAPILN